MYQMRMRIHKSRQYYASAQIELFRRSSLRKGFHRCPCSGSRDQAVVHQQRAIFNQVQVGKRITAPRTASA